MLSQRPSCQYRHPDLCAASTCVPHRAPSCVLFHGRYKEDQDDDANKASMGNNEEKGNNIAKMSSQKHAQGNGRRGGPPPQPQLRRQVQQQVIPLLIRPTLGGSASSLNGSRKELQEMKRELASIKKLPLSHTPHLTKELASAAVAANTPPPPINYRDLQKYVPKRG